MSSSTVQGNILITRSVEEVWDALVNPSKVIQYLGSTLKTDWKAGSAITWEGDMHGTPFVNKGVVLTYQPYTLLKYSYWSGMGGDADAPENYSEVTYQLTEQEGGVYLNYTRENIPTIIEQQIFQTHINSMLESIKKIIETD
jgi:uncharacterized protein YndB with AHSA1/START domain